MFIRFIRDKFKSESGITMIELLIVIAIIAILAGGIILLIDPGAQKGKANDAKRKSDLAQLQRGLEMYYQDRGSYPSSAGNIVDGRAWGTSWPSYMTMLPKDPIAVRTYIYYSTGQAYFLYAYLQAPKDPQMCFPATGAECSSVGANGLVPNLCGGPCNYGATSPNVTP